MTLPKIYGQHHLVFNLHGLIRIEDDCKYFNKFLNNISCFPFSFLPMEIKTGLLGEV